MASVTETQNIMNIVVESRKRFGKMCVDYSQKTSVVDNKRFNLKLETYSHVKLKNGNPVPEMPDDLKWDWEIEDFSSEFVETEQRVDDLRKLLKNTQRIVCQLKVNLGLKRREEQCTELRIKSCTDSHTMDIKLEKVKKVK